MGWWSNLFGRSKTLPSTLIRVPTEGELIPGRLVARVVAHDLSIGNTVIPCWSYSTTGLAAVGQDELVFTLKRRPNETPDVAPADPFLLLQQVFSLAEQGRVVDPGGFSVFGAPRGFLGVTSQVGFIYVRPPVAVPEVPLTASPRALLMILLRPEEAAVVQQLGTYRILSLLGRANRYYPHPHWSDRDRPAVADVADFNASVVSRVGVGIDCPNASVRVVLGESRADGIDRVSAGHADTLELSLTREEGDRLEGLLRTLGSNGTCVLFTSPDSESDVRLVWSPGATEMQTITPAGSTARTMTGGFLLVAFGSGVEDGGRVVEDGFGMIFCETSWEAFLASLKSGVEVRIANRVSHLHSFAVRFQN